MKDLDVTTANGFIAQISLLIFAKINAIMGNVELQGVSYMVTILVGIDLLTGSPIKSAFTKLWKRLCDGFK